MLLEMASPIAIVMVWVCRMAIDKPREIPITGLLMSHSKNLLLAFLGCVSLVACAGGKKDAPKAGASLAPQTPQGKFDSGPAGVPADLAKAQQEAMAAAINRSVKQEEFVLTLIADDPAILHIDSINIDVISTDAKNAARLAGEGPVKYRDSRIKTNAARSHMFAKGGAYFFPLKVPTITPSDSVVLWAELAAPSKGSDTRMLVIPLELDKSDPAKGPVAKPITVKLTVNGWVREG